MTELVYAEDLKIATPYPAGEHVITTAEIIAFARQWDPLPIHTDEAAAAEMGFDGIIASGIHSFAIFQRLVGANIYAGWQIIAGRRVRELEFPKPVLGGTTLRATVTVDKVEARSRGRSLMHKSGVLIDDAGDAVFRMQAEVYIRNRQDLESQRHR